MTTAMHNMEHDLCHALQRHSKDLPNNAYLLNVFNHPDIFMLTARDKFEVILSLLSPAPSLFLRTLLMS